MARSADPSRLPASIRRRREAALAGHHGDADAARRMLDDEDPRVRATALGALARAGAVTAGDTARAATDPSPEVRRRAAEVVAASPLARTSLLALLADEDASVVEVAAWACGEITPPEAGAVEALAALATASDDAIVREAAVAALGAIGDERGLTAILAATRDKATVRRRAIIALAPFDGPEVDAALDAATTDRDWQVRQAAEDLRRD